METWNEYNDGKLITKTMYSGKEHVIKVVDLNTKEVLYEEPERQILHLDSGESKVENVMSEITEMLQMVYPLSGADELLKTDIQNYDGIMSFKNHVLDVLDKHIFSKCNLHINGFVFKQAYIEIIDKDDINNELVINKFVKTLSGYIRNYPDSLQNVFSNEVFLFKEFYYNVAKHYHYINDMFEHIIPYIYKHYNVYLTPSYVQTDDIDELFECICEDTIFNLYPGECNTDKLYARCLTDIDFIFKSSYGPDLLIHDKELLKYYNYLIDKYALKPSDKVTKSELLFLCYMSDLRNTDYREWYNHDMTTFIPSKITIEV